MTRLQIHNAGPYANDADKDHAEDAAIEILDAAGFTPCEAQAEFSRQRGEGTECGDMIGAARAWHEAHQAARRALTEGWAGSSAANCEIGA
jgi:hypothetical protein